MFTPDLDLTVAKRSSIFRIEEKTGVDTGDGDKWDGVSGLDSSTLTSAIIRIITPSATYTDNDVLSQIGSPVTGTFDFNDITGTYVDGLYNFVYSLKTVDFAIASYADYGSTIAGTVLVNATGHGLVTGMYASITGTTSYNADYYATRVDDNNFHFAATWVADDGASTGTVMYKDTFYPYVYSNAEAGIETMFANIARMTSGENRDLYLADAITINGLLQSIKSAITSANETALDNILAEINQMLDFREVEVEF